MLNEHQQTPHFGHFFIISSLLLEEYPHFKRLSMNRGFPNGQIDLCEVKLHIWVNVELQSPIIHQIRLQLGHLLNSLPLSALFSGAAKTM